MTLKNGMKVILTMYELRDGNSDWVEDDGGDAVNMSPTCCTNREEGSYRVGQHNQSDKGNHVQLALRLARLAIKGSPMRVLVSIVQVAI